jgi:HPt (histidine-containing phosphotransfer) domain-containing protein
VRTTDTELVLDLEQLRQVTLEDRKLMREILWALIEDTGRHAGLLESSLRAGDVQRSAKLARRSAAACANVGAHRAGDTLRAIERLTCAGELTSCVEVLATLRTELEFLRGEAVKL